MGIFVDIFPLDLSPEYSPSLEKAKKLIRRLHYVSLERSTRYMRGIKSFAYKTISLFVPNKLCYKWQRHLALSASKKGKSHYANFGSQYALRKQVMPVEWYGKGVPLCFEDRYYNAPAAYPRVLESIYGKNYMRLPPVEKRRSHYPERVVFSDHTELVFGKERHRVTVEEQ